MDWHSILQQSRVDFSFILPEAMLGQLQTMGDVYAVYRTRLDQRPRRDR